MTTVTKPRVSWGDLLWVAWRRHRAVVLVTAGLVAAAAAVMVFAGVATDQELSSLPAFYFRLLWDPLYFNLLFGAAVAVFWGAPLLAREHEARTNLVVWGQDVRGTRWLAGQVALLGVAATAFATVVWLSTEDMVNSLREASGNRFNQPFTAWFEVAPQVQIGHTLFGFALGVAAGAVTRRVLPAMALALIGFTVVRMVVVQWVRAYYLPPVRTFQPWDSPYEGQVPDYALYVANGNADANGVPIVDQNVDCRGGWDAQVECLKANGVAGTYSDFQPLERLGLFQWIEAGIFLVLAAALLVLAWSWVKRAHRV